MLKASKRTKNNHVELPAMQTQGRSKPVRGVTAAHQSCFKFNLFKFCLAKRIAFIFHHYIPKKDKKNSSIVHESSLIVINYFALCAKFFTHLWPLISATSVIPPTLNLKYYDKKQGHFKSINFKAWRINNVFHPRYEST